MTRNETAGMQGVRLHSSNYSSIFQFIRKKQSMTDDKIARTATEKLTTKLANLTKNQSQLVQIPKKNMKMKIPFKIISISSFIYFFIIFY